MKQISYNIRKGIDKEDPLQTDIPKRTGKIKKVRHGVKQELKNIMEEINYLIHK